MVEFNHSEEHLDEDMIMIQANIDDMNPEYCSHIMDLLFDLGANDVFWIPIIMKKGRPGLMLNVLASETKQENLAKAIFQETTTLGLRYWKTNCHRLARSYLPVRTPWGEVDVKIGEHEGRIVQYAPEFKQCEAIAKTYNVPLKEVYDQVRVAYLTVKSKQGNE